MNLCWPVSSLKMHQNSDSLRTQWTMTFLRQYFEFLSIILTLILGTIHFNLFFFLPYSFPSFASFSLAYYLVIVLTSLSATLTTELLLVNSTITSSFSLAYYLVIVLTSLSATLTTELLLVNSTITSSFSLASVTLPINPSCAPLTIITSAPISNFGFFSSFSCQAPSPSPLGLGFRISNSFNAFFLLCPMPRYGVKPMLCNIDMPKFSTGLPSQACRSGASAYLEKVGSCFISFKQ